MVRNQLDGFGVSATGTLLAAALFVSLAAPQAAWAQATPQKVVLRFVADFPPPPHPAGLAMAQRLLRGILQAGVGPPLRARPAPGLR